MGHSGSFVLIVLFIMVVVPRVLILVVALCALWASAAVNPQHKPKRPWHKPHKSRNTPQPDCDPDSCGVYAGTPDCTCAAVENPLLDEAELLPQLVVLTFDDAITDFNYDFYIDDLVNRYKNPNECPIQMTFFVNHKYNDYARMNTLHRLGQEIAAHSVSNVPDVEGYWRVANYSTWFSEINDVKQMIMTYGKIPEEDIKGWRAPFLEVGGDIMYQALVDAGFQYDSSISTFVYSNWYPEDGTPEGALFPHTLDYPSNLECSVGTCPSGVYPGFWVTPMIDLNDPRPMIAPTESPNDVEAPHLRAPCNMLDSCVEYNATTEGSWDCSEDYCKDNIVQWLKDSFNNHYNNNRAPFGLYSYYAWFRIDETIESRHKEAYLEFLDWLVEKDDVYFTTLSTVIEYMKDPQYAEDMEFWDPVKCTPPQDTNCPDPITCTYEHDLPFDAERVRMSICTRPCPAVYPWLGDVNGDG